MGHIHINIPRGYYIGQTRLLGHRLWRTLECSPRKDRRFKSPEDALAAAVRAMGTRTHRARVLFIAADGWYEPRVVMEAHRC